jgi:Rps23 Pro-64 3,4-dihydroxylase Tpa1-like proline 4-hydroxylase
MAYESIWYYTEIPENIIETIENDLNLWNFDNEMQKSVLEKGLINNKKRSSKNAWISTDYWVSGFLWNYVQKANKENFNYDIEGIDGESLQYTRYDKGDFYGWHTDGSISNNCASRVIASSSNPPDDPALMADYLVPKTNKIRKISFTLQLSNPDEYSGGNLQFQDEDGRTYFAPRQRGALTMFDSRVLHRVLKVKEGTRKSIVGWVIGPQWR